MLRTLSLSLFALFLATPFAVAQDASFVGDWSGALAGQAGEVAIALHISEDAEGLTTTLDIPQAGATDHPASSTSVEDGSILIEFADAQISITGTHAEDGTIDATWAQAGQEVPLTLTAVEAGAEGEASSEEAPEDEAQPEEMHGDHEMGDDHEMHQDEKMHEEEAPEND